MSLYRLKTWWKSFEKYPKLNWVLSILGLFFLSFVAFIAHLGSVGLIDKTEPMFVEAARQMTVTGDWITPYWNGETRFDKPPLVYWLMAIAFNIFGVNEGAARIPSALGAIAILVLGFYTLRRYGISRPTNPDPDTTNRQRWLSAWIGAIILALNPAIVAWGRTGVSDMLLASCTTLALLAFFLGYAQSENKPKSLFSLPKGWYLAFYIFLALAILAKGPVGIVLPIGIIGCFLLYVGRLKAVFWEMSAIAGVLIASAIAIPWFILVTAAHPDYINTFFGLHNVQRFTSVVSNHPGPWYYYFPVVLVGLAPWSIFLPVAIARLRFWQRDRWMQSPRSTHLGLFALFWVVIIFIFFSISVTKLPSYVLPLMPALAIIVTLYWSDDREEKSGLVGSGVINIIVLVALAIASFLSPNLIGEDPDVPGVGQALQQSGLPVQSGIIWAIAAGWGIFLLIRRSHRRWFWSANLVAFLAFMTIIAPPAAQLMDIERQLPLRQLSAIVKQQPSGEELILIGFIRPSVVYYTQRSVNFIKTPQLAEDHLAAKSTSSLIISKPQDIQETGLQPNQYQTLGKAGAYQLIRVSTIRSS